MSMQAAGYTCPYCGYDIEMRIIGWLRDEDGYMLGADLECPKCAYQWREVNWE